MERCHQLKELHEGQVQPLLLIAAAVNAKISISLTPFLMKMFRLHHRRQFFYIWNLVGEFCFACKR